MTKRTWIVLTALVLAATVALVVTLTRTSSPSDVAKKLSLLPAKSVAVVGLDLKVFLTPATRDVVTQGLADLGFRPIDGFDPMTLDRVLGAKLPQGWGIILNGRFNAEKVIRALAERLRCDARTDAGFGCVIQDPAANLHVALLPLDENTFVIGDEAGARALKAAYLGRAPRLTEGPVFAMLGEVDDDAAIVAAGFDFTARGATKRGGAFSLSLADGLDVVVYAEGLPKGNLSELARRVETLRMGLDFVSPEMLKGMVRGRARELGLPKGLPLDAFIETGLSLGQSLKVDLKRADALRATASASLPKDATLMIVTTVMAGLRLFARR